MEILQESKDINKKSFFTHVFSSTEEGKAEVLNVVQYATMGIVPIVILLFVKRFFPHESICLIVLIIFLPFYLFFIPLILPV